MNELVKRLSTGVHPIVASRVESAKDLKDCLERNYVLIKFTETRGGTELGVKIDETATNLSDADFSNGKGIAHIVGTLKLNYVKVRCIADINLEEFKGNGHLEIIGE